MPPVVGVSGADRIFSARILTRSLLFTVTVLASVSDEGAVDILSRVLYRETGHSVHYLPRRVWRKSNYNGLLIITEKSYDVHRVYRLVSGVEECIDWCRV